MRGHNQALLAVLAGVIVVAAFVVLAVFHSPWWLIGYFASVVLSFLPFLESWYIAHCFWRDEDARLKEPCNE